MSTNSPATSIMPSTSATDSPRSSTWVMPCCRGLALRSGRSSRSASRAGATAWRRGRCRRSRRPWPCTAGRAGRRRPACCWIDRLDRRRAELQRLWRRPAPRACGPACTPRSVDVRVWSEAVATRALLVAGAVSCLRDPAGEAGGGGAVEHRHRDRRRALTARGGLRPVARRRRVARGGRARRARSCCRCPVKCSTATTIAAIDERAAASSARRRPSAACAAARRARGGGATGARPARPRMPAPAGGLPARDVRLRGGRRHSPRWRVTRAGDAGAALRGAVATDGGRVAAAAAQRRVVDRLPASAGDAVPSYRRAAAGARESRDQPGGRGQRRCRDAGRRRRRDGVAPPAPRGTRAATPGSAPAHARRRSRRRPRGRSDLRPAARRCWRESWSAAPRAAATRCAGLVGLLAQVGGLAGLREVQQDEDRQADDRGEAGVGAHRVDEVVDREGEGDRSPCCVRSLRGDPGVWTVGQPAPGAARASRRARRALPHRPRAPAG